MKNASPKMGWPSFQGGRHQRGQAMIYGIFILAVGLVSTFFLFNAGQLVQEKDRLITTADATAYSAGVLHARALNYSAYINRALIANEITVAQTVSVASWVRYTERHVQTAVSEGCNYYINVPGGLSFLRYTPLCMGLAYGGSYIASASSWVDSGGQAVIVAAEVAKKILQGAQLFMMAELALKRDDILTEVAKANFKGDGDVSVMTMPIPGDNPIETSVKLWTGKDRQRFANVAVESANRDPFIPSRSWNEKALLPETSCLKIFNWEYDYATRSGGTSLIGLDEWKAMDTFEIHKRMLKFKTKKIGFIKIKVPYCGAEEWYPAAGLKASYAIKEADKGSTAYFAGARNINNLASKTPANSTYSGYQGMPVSWELTNDALSYVPNHADVNHREFKIRYSILVTRKENQTRTSEGRSAVKSAPGPYGLNKFDGKPAAGEYSAVSTAEIFFDRPVAREDGKTEIASLYNPYWQVRLVQSKAAIAAGMVIQGVK